VNESRKVVGIGGIDAHAHQHKLLAGLVEVTVFRYKVQFQTVRTHLLLPVNFQPGMEINEAKQLIYDALLNCRVFVSNYFNGEARGFFFAAENSINQVALGDELNLDQSTWLRVHLPAAAEVRWIRNGEIIKQESGQDLQYSVSQPGLYRVEIFRKNRAWIYSNHIRIVRAT